MEFILGIFCGIIGTIIAKPTDVKFLHDMLYKCFLKVVKKKKEEN
jgi:hypothetical protein